MRLRTLFRLFLLLAAVAPITTAKADSLIIGTDTLRLDLHWLDDTPLDELARNDRVFEKKFQALIHQPTAEGFVIYIDGDHEHHSYWRLIDDKLYLDHTIRKSDYSEIDFSGIFVRDHTGFIIRPPSIQAHFLYQAYSTRTERSPYSFSRRGD